MPPRRLSSHDLALLATHHPALSARLAARTVGSPMTVVHDGVGVAAFEGEVLALSLLAADRLVLSRSPKYHRPRGATCLRGHCEGCLVRYDGEPNVMACLSTVRRGAEAHSQNAFPTAGLDLMRVTDWFFPKHLDHHHLMVDFGAAVNRTMQRLTRKLAGLGTLPEEPRTPVEAAEHTVDALVVGAGQSGIGAANALAAAGLRVLVCDEAPAPGGAALDALDTPLDTLARLDPRVGCLTGTAAVATYDDTTLLVDGVRLHSVRARARVFANGGIASVGTFVNNDAPGVYTRDAFARALRQGVLASDRALFVGPGAAALGAIAKTLPHRGHRIEAEGTVVEAVGTGRVKGAVLTVGGARRQVTNIEALVVDTPAHAAYELAGQAGAEIVWSPAMRCFTPQRTPDGATRVPGVFVTGSLCLGEATVAARHADGARVGAHAAEWLNERATP